MKRIYLVAALAAMAGSAHAAEGVFPKWYVGLGGSYAYHADSDYGSGTTIEFDDGFGFSAALGYRPVDAGFMRLEAEVVHVGNDLDKLLFSGTSTTLNGSLSTSAIMANLLFDFRNASRWTPFIGGGVGIATVNYDDNSANDVDDTAFAWQLRAGLAYSPASMPNLDLTLGYRFLATGDVDIAGTDLGDNMTHHAELGARFNF